MIKYLFSRFIYKNYNNNNNFQLPLFVINTFKKMKIKPNSMFKIKSKANSTVKSATPKNYSVGDNFSDVLLPNPSDSEATTPEKPSSVRYRKSDPSQPGEGQKFIKNSPYKKQRRRQDDSSDSKQQCCSIV